MLTETARVVARDCDGLWVETIRKSTCNSCSAQKGCGHGLLNRMSDGRRNLVRVLPGDCDTRDYEIGDDVVVALPEDVLLRGSVIVYLVPLVATLVGAGLGSWFNPQAGDVASAIGALLGFASGIGLVRMHALLHRGDTRFHPTLVGAAEPHAAIIASA